MSLSRLFGNGEALFCLEAAAIYLNIYSAIDRLFKRSIASKLHFSKQIPFCTHILIDNVILFNAPEIAPTGQLQAQIVQPVHFSFI